MTLPTTRSTERIISLPEKIRYFRECTTVVLVPKTDEGVTPEDFRKDMRVLAARFGLIGYGGAVVSFNLESCVAGNEDYITYMATFFDGASVNRFRLIINNLQRFPYAIDDHSSYPGLNRFILE